MRQSPAPAWAQSLVLLWLVSVIGFAVLHLAPGGPLPVRPVPGMTQAELARIAASDGPRPPACRLQYWEWVRRMLTGDWGHSYRDNQPVLAIIGGRICRRRSS